MPSTCVCIQQMCLRIHFAQGIASGPHLCVGCVGSGNLQFLFCVNDHLCLLLEITLFVTQTYSNPMEICIPYEVKNTKLIKHFRKHAFKFEYLMPQANLLEFQMNIYFCNYKVNE